MSLLFFILAAHGLTQLLCHGKVFDRIRPNGYFWTCSMCMGFWVGVFLCAINPLTELFTFEMKVLNLFICGWISSGTSYALDKLFGDNGLRVTQGEEVVMFRRWMLRGVRRCKNGC